MIGPTLPDPSTQPVAHSHCRDCDATFTIIYDAAAHGWVEGHDVRSGKRPDPVEP